MFTDISLVNTATFHENIRIVNWDFSDVRINKAFEINKTIMKINLSLKHNQNVQINKSIDGILIDLLREIQSLSLSTFFTLLHIGAKQGCHQ